MKHFIIIISYITDKSSYNVKPYLRLYKYDKWENTPLTNNDI